MANVGTAQSGRTLIGAGNNSSPKFAPIGTDSGLTQYGVLIGQGNGAFQATGQGILGQVLQSQGAANPAYSTATYPSLAGTSGNVLTSDGTNWLSSPLPAAVDLHGPKFIAGDTSNGANYSTIAAASAAAGAGNVVYIQGRSTPYVEDITLLAGQTLSSLPGSGFNGNVTIQGKLTATFSGTATVSGIRLKTNGDAFLEVSGSNATKVYINNCWLECSDATGIEVTTSSSGSLVELNYCRGDITATGISLFNYSGAGQISPYYCSIGNTGGSTTDSTISSGIFEAEFSVFVFGITTSGTATYSSISCTFTPAGVGLNRTALTAGSVGNHGCNHSIYSSGSATAIVINNGALLLYNSDVSSTNASAISGTGTIYYSGVTFSNSSKKIAVSTQIGGTMAGGLTQNPTAGFVGETISSSAALASVAMVNNTPKTVTSISLTAGVWDVSSLCAVSGVLTGTRFQTSISATNNTLGSGGIGNDTTDGPTMPNAAANVTHTISSVRVLLTATTTYYLVANVAFTVGTATTGGTIRATRVG
jgi:hypothetical protein